MIKNGNSIDLNPEEEKWFKRGGEDYTRGEPEPYKTLSNMIREDPDPDWLTFREINSLELAYCLGWESANVQASAARDIIEREKKKITERLLMKRKGVRYK